MRLNEGLERLGNGAFESSAIQDIQFPSSLRKIESDTFFCCKNLRGVKIPSGVECIGKRCFKGSGIEEVTLPSTLHEIGNDAFKNCGSLKTVWIERKCRAKVRQCVPKNVGV